MHNRIEQINQQLQTQSQSLLQWIEQTFQPFANSPKPQPVVAPSGQTPPITKLLAGAAITMGALATYVMAKNDSTALGIGLLTGAAASGYGAYAANQSVQARQAKFRANNQAPQASGASQQQLIGTINAVVGQLQSRWDSLMQGLQQQAQAAIEPVADSAQREALRAKIYVYDTPNISQLQLIELAKSATHLPSAAAQVKAALLEAVRTATQKQADRYRSLLQ